MPSRKFLAFLLGVLSAMLLPTQTLLAQTRPVPPDSSKVYIYVEQMPEMPGTPGIGAIGAERWELMGSVKSPVGGKVYVSFTVGPSGGAYGPKIVKKLDAATDAAVLDAVLRLPRFVPGKQNGKPVAVSFTVAVAVPGK